MNYRVLGKTGWQVTELSLGCATHVVSWNEEEERNFVATVHRALELGVNFFDTSDSYRTEGWLAKALGNRSRDVYVATKVGKYAEWTRQPLSYAVPEHIYLCCDASLHRLRTDYIDLYFCHLDPPADVGVFIEAFEMLKRQGKIRHYGVSTNDAALLEAFNRTGECAACEMDYNILDRRAELALLPYAEAHDIGTVVRRPLEKGILSGTMHPDMVFADWVRKRWNQGQQRAEYQDKVRRVEALRFLESPDRTLVAAALQFLFANPAVSCAIPGASRPQRLDQYLQAYATQLTPAEIARIDAITDPRVTRQPA